LSDGSRRIDKWLWFARFFKSRTLATRFCQSGKLRINGTHTTKAHQKVCVGDVLTFAKGPHVRVVRIQALGERRGPAREAQMLYEDLNPPETAGSPSANPALGRGPIARREPGSGRPTKAERRATDRLRNG